MRSRIKYIKGELEPEIVVTLTPAEVAVVSTLIFNNLSGHDDVRRDLEQFYKLSIKLFGTSQIPEDDMSNDSNTIIKNLPDLLV